LCQPSPAAKKATNRFSAGFIFLKSKIIFILLFKKLKKKTTND